MLARGDAGAPFWYLSHMNPLQIKEAFEREFRSAQDARSELHAKFAEQGVRLIEHRKRLVEVVITVSAAVIAAPAVFKITPDPRLYDIGLTLLVVTIVFALLHLREHVDTDEARTAQTRNVLLPILNRRIEKLKEYLQKDDLSQDDAASYQKYREEEDYSKEMNELTKENEEKIATLHIKAIDYPSSLIMLLFTSGAFFVVISVLFQNLSIPVILLLEVFIMIITATNSADKVTRLYANVLSFFR